MKKSVSIVMLVMMLVVSSAFAIRIKSGDVARKIQFVAYDATDANRVTTVASLTAGAVYYSIDGGTATAMTTPTIAAIDAVNMQGVFSLAIDEAGMVALPADANEAELMLYITGSNAITVPLSVEIYKDDESALTAYGVAKTSDITDYNAPTFAEMTSAFSALNDISKTDVNSCVVGIDWSRVAEPNSIVNLKRTTIQRTYDPNNQNAEGNALKKIRSSVTVQQ
ncbi:MAG TPA: hypothetical protein DDW84_00120 [Phycisphaerales bacterium]|nr:MAG: hypothetical protein A2Y13_02035 [Planctomycetes bacterium GWC2_45_44]HBG77242.1 hypothetical protein [Phycisphaerales bacterium]HBR19201.1 hypothetical protein [Phycisphaerales bacterium]